ncbi:MAG: hypothetical protein J0665_03735 [Deltaproteobacteria bacterium]|jgi:hypothetical protein|nr:hypothetical protein [Deltaproteobacteria bacterium]
MPVIQNKYFWDGSENLSTRFKVQRIIEYASFPDMINFPFKEFQKGIETIDPEKLRTSEKRKRFVIMAKPYIAGSQSWEEIVEKMIA